MREAEYCSMSWSLPVFVVDSAASRTASKCSSSQTPNSRAPRAPSKMNDGARYMRSSRIVVFTPPASWSSRMPRLYDATSVPSAVASGT